MPRALPAGAHFQSIGLHEVERAQHAETGEHAQVIPGEGEIVLAEVFRVEAGVDIALEGEQRLLGVLRGELRMPAGVASGAFRPASLSESFISSLICSGVSWRSWISSWRGPGIAAG